MAEPRSIGGNLCLLGPKTLVVEADSDHQLLLKTWLTGLDAMPHVAKNGGEALAMVARTDAQLVLMDLIMPVMSGFETFAARRSQDWAGPGR